MDKNFKVNIDTGQAVQNVDNLNDSLENSIEAALRSAEKFENITKVAAGLTGAFLTVTSAMGLMGIESEETTKMIAKLLQVMAMTEGFKTIGEGAGAFLKLKKATDTTSKAMGGLKKAIIGTGIGLFVVLIADLIANFDDLRKEFDFVDKAASALESVWDGLIGVFKNSKLELKALGNLILDVLLLPLKNVITFSKGVGEAFKHLFAGEFDAAVKSVKNIGTELKKNATDIKDSAKLVGDAFKTGYVNGINEAAKATKALTEELKKALEERKKLLAEFDEEYRRSQLTDFLNLLDDLLKWYDLQYELVKNDEERLLNLKKWYLDKYNEILELNGITTGALLAESLKLEVSATTEKLEILNGIIEDSRTTWLKFWGNAVRGANDFSESFDKMDIDSKISTTSNLVAMTALAMGDMFGSIASNFNENSEEYRALMITLTIMSMIAGIAMAVSTAMELGPIAGPIIGAINAATVLASGIASINLLKSANENTNVSGLASSSGASIVSATAVLQISSPIASATVLGDSSQLADNKVYVTETDITKSLKDRNKLRTSVKF